MKVKDLIQKLSEMPGDANIAIEINERTESFDCSTVDEVYETPNGEVVIQGYNF